LSEKGLNIDQTLTKNRPKIDKAAALLCFYAAKKSSLKSRRLQAPGMLANKLIHRTCAKLLWQLLP
jgi:hypothetical protein